MGTTDLNHRDWIFNKIDNLFVSVLLLSVEMSLLDKTTSRKREKMRFL